MNEIIDQPAPGSSAVPALPLAPAIEAIEPETALAAVRDEVLARFDDAGTQLARDQDPAFAALADALARLVALEWCVLAPRARDGAHARLSTWRAAMPATIAALADLGHDARDDDLSRALLRRRAWQHGDAFRESLAWRRMHCEAPGPRLAAN